MGWSASYTSGSRVSWLVDGHASLVFWVSWGGFLCCGDATLRLFCLSLVEELNRGVFFLCSIGLAFLFGSLVYLHWLLHIPKYLEFEFSNERECKVSEI